MEWVVWDLVFKQIVYIMLFVGNLFRYSIFSMHWIFIIYNIIPIFSYNIFIFPLVIASWKLNDDYCIFTQLEEKYLGKTLFLQKKAKRVTRIHQKIFYLVCGINILYKLHLGYHTRSN